MPTVSWCLEHHPVGLLQDWLSQQTGLLSLCGVRWKWRMRVSWPSFCYTLRHHSFVTGSPCNDGDNTSARQMTCLAGVEQGSDECLSLCSVICYLAKWQQHIKSFTPRTPCKRRTHTGRKEKGRFSSANVLDRLVNCYSRENCCFHSAKD